MSAEKKSRARAKRVVVLELLVVTDAALKRLVPGNVRVVIGPSLPEGELADVLSVTARVAEIVAAATARDLAPK